jgi:hypothetical protein
MLGKYCADYACNTLAFIFAEILCAGHVDDLLFVVNPVTGAPVNMGVTP